MEFDAGLAQIRRFLEAHGNSRFQTMGEEVDAKIIYRAGFRRRDDEGRWEYFVLPECWKSEVCKGHDATTLGKELAQRGFLVRDKGDGKLSARHKLPGMGGTKRCYHLSANIVSDGAERV